MLSGPGHAADTAQSIPLTVKKCRGHPWICLATSQRWSLGDSNPELFHAIDSRPVRWSGLEAGDWSPASAVDRDCASGLVSSLVSSVVVKLTFSSRRHGVDLIGRAHGVIEVQVAAAGALWLHRGGTHGAHG